jgi:beta-lactamase regulating signal transducer with metallopeptidase domain
MAQINEIAQIWWGWMAGMFWQVSLFIVLITILDMAIRRRAWPQLRYAHWGLVFLKLIIPPTWQMPTSIVSWLQPQVEEQITFQSEGETSVSSSVFNLLGQKQDNDTIVSRPTFQSLLLLTWFGGMVAFSFLLLRKRSKLSKWHQNLDDRDVPQWFYELLIKTVKRLNLNRVPAVAFSKDAVSPAVYGILRPSLLLPQDYLDELSREQAEHVLLHELCHLKRGDLWTHGICLTLQIVYWFNPLLIWTRRQMRHVCEICCDLSVADILREKTKAYRDTLLNNARELLTERVEPSLGLLGLFEEPFRLVTRLKWLEKTTWENRKRKRVTTLCTSLLIVACVMPMGAASQPESPQASVQKDLDLAGPSVMIEARIVSVDDKEKLDHPLEASFTATGNGFVFGGKRYQSLDSWLARMEREKILNVISAPRVLAVVDQEVKFETQTIADSDNDMGQSAHIDLTIIPQIKPDRVVSLDISLESKRPDGTKKTHKTKIMLKDAEMALIGGVSPYGKTEEGELLIFLTPTILEKPENAFDTSMVEEKWATIDFDDVDIRAFIKYISELTGKIFVIDQRVRGKVTIQAPSKVSVEEVYRIFEAVLEVHGYTQVPSGEIIKIVPIGDKRG